jgi:hypothetical protein
MRRRQTPKCQVLAIKAAKVTPNPHIGRMTAPKAQRPEKQKTPEQIASLAKKELQAAEGRLAMAEYHRDKATALERMAELRAHRLAQVAKVKPPKPKQTKKQA